MMYRIVQCLARIRLLTRRKCRNNTYTEEGQREDRGRYRKRRNMHGENPKRERKVEQDRIADEERMQEQYLHTSCRKNK